jgi:hypothetical protein
MHDSSVFSTISLSSILIYDWFTLVVDPDLSLEYFCPPALHHMTVNPHQTLSKASIPHIIFYARVHASYAGYKHCLYTGYIFEESLHSICTGLHLQRSAVDLHGSAVDLQPDLQNLVAPMEIGRPSIDWIQAE